MSEIIPEGMTLVQPRSSHRRSLSRSPSRTPGYLYRTSGAVLFSYPEDSLVGTGALPANKEENTTSTAVNQSHSTTLRLHPCMNKYRQVSLSARYNAQLRAALSIASRTTKRITKRTGALRTTNICRSCLVLRAECTQQCI